MPKGFSEQEKDQVREALIAACEASWAKYGYKRTSVDAMCESAGISKGGFYLFFGSKEELFYQTILRIQRSLYKLAEEILTEEQNKYGVARALKTVYAQYDKNPFLYDTSGADFTIFFSKLNQEQRESIQVDSLEGARNMLDKPWLTLLVEEELALSVLSALLNTVAGKDKMRFDNLSVFAFMLDNLIEKLFV